jgi:hypothetical protein
VPNADGGDTCCVYCGTAVGHLRFGDVPPTRPWLLPHPSLLRSERLFDGKAAVDAFEAMNFPHPSIEHFSAADGTSRSSHSSGQPNEFRISTNGPGLTAKAGPTLVGMRMEAHGSVRHNSDEASAPRSDIVSPKGSGRLRRTPGFARDDGDVGDDGGGDVNATVMALGWAHQLDAHLQQREDNYLAPPSRRSASGNAHE